MSMLFFMPCPIDKAYELDCWWDWIKQEARRLDAKAISAEEAGRTQAHDEDG
jgi:hypothetical protein